MPMRLAVIRRQSVLNACLIAVGASSLFEQFGVVSSTAASSLAIACSAVAFVCLFLGFKEKRASRFEAASSRDEVTIAQKDPVSRMEILDPDAEVWIRKNMLGHDRNFDRGLAPNSLVMLRNLSPSMLQDSNNYSAPGSREDLDSYKKLIIVGKEARHPANSNMIFGFYYNRNYSNFQEHASVFTHASTSRDHRYIEKK